MSSIDAFEGTPVSLKIRERLKASRKRFHANDNIADFIQPGELETLLDEVEVQMRGVLNSLVIDIENDHNTDCAQLYPDRNFSVARSLRVFIWSPAQRLSAIVPLLYFKAKGWL